ncbi:MAG: GGDEF domain-containing protein [Clostridiales bacterium]|nr:GGDEF domain-containing protein [Clostridiales bacterium]
MTLSGYFTINLYSIAILAIIFIQMLRSSDKYLLPQKLFMWVLLVTAVMLVMDILSRFDGHPGTLYEAANHIGNFMIFLLSPILPSIWLLYTHSRVQKGECKIRRFLFLLPTLSGVNAVMLILSQFFGWFYTIGAGNIYRRGPMFWFPVAVTLIITVATFILVIANRNKLEKKHFNALLLFPVPPLVCILLQIIYYGTSLILNGATLSILTVFVTIQNERMNLDYLTSAYNRKGLETYIRQKINASTEHKTFAAILLDLDNFKSINDSFGHSTGDHVLVESTKLLRSCLRSDDLIARYGGDEFYIIMNISDPDELENIACRIRTRIQEYNDSSNEPYKIGFSMGYTVYNFHNHLNVEQFHKQLDGLMYESKRAVKGN